MCKHKDYGEFKIPVRLHSVYPKQQRVTRISGENPR